MTGEVNFCVPISWPVSQQGLDAFQVTAGCAHCTTRELIKKNTPKKKKTVTQLPGIHTSTSHVVVAHRETQWDTERPHEDKRQPTRLTTDLKFGSTNKPVRAHTPVKTKRAPSLNPHHSLTARVCTPLLVLCFFSRYKLTGRSLGTAEAARGRYGWFLRISTRGEEDSVSQQLDKVNQLHREKVDRWIKTDLYSISNLQDKFKWLNPQWL